MLAQRRRRWANIKPALAKYFVFESCSRLPMYNAIIINLIALDRQSIYSTPLQYP